MTEEPNFIFASLDEALEALKADEKEDYQGYEDRGSFGGKIAYGQSWEKLFTERHSKGGGPYGGLNNAVTRLVAVFRNRNLPYDFALRFGQQWNREQCDPPIPAGEFHNLFGQLWARLKPAEEEFTAEAVNDGEWEVLSLADLLDHCPDGLPWLIENVFLTGGLHFLSAPPGGSKSWLLMSLMAALVEGKPWFGMDCPKRPVLWLDEEMGKNIAGERARRLRMPYAKAGLTYLGRQGVKLDNPKTLKKVVEMAETNPGLIIVIDTLIRIHDFEENDSRQMAKLYTLLKKIMETGATIICACHESGKMSFGPSDRNQVKHGRVRGSSEIIGQADMVFSVEKHEGFYKLITIKNRLTADHNNLEVNFVLQDHFDAGDTKGLRVEVKQISEMEAGQAEQQSKQQSVYKSLDYLELRGMEHIMPQTGLDKPTILAAINALKTAGEITEETLNKQPVYKKTAFTGF